MTMILYPQKKKENGMYGSCGDYDEEDDDDDDVIIMMWWVF